MRWTPSVQVFVAYVVFTLVFGIAVPWLICAHYDIRYHPQDFYPMQKPGGDYVATYVAARSLLSGRNIYDHLPDSVDWSATGPISRYAYAPPQAYLLMPLALLDFERSRVIWIGLTIALVALSAWIASRLFEAPWLVFLACCAVYAQSSFMHFQFERGQTDVLPLICIVLSVYCHVGRRNSYLAGFFCAVGAVIKVIPAVLLLFFLLRRDWRAIFTTILSAAVLIVATGLADWRHWYQNIVPAWSGLFIGQNVDHSLVYFFEAFTGGVETARLLARIAGMLLFGAYAALVLVNRQRDRHVLVELAILTTIIEISTPWSLNYKLVMLLFLFLAPFAILSIERVRARPVLHALPLMATFVLIVPVFGEYLTRLPFALLVHWLPVDLVISNPIDPIIADRKVALGIVLALAYLLWLYGRAALTTRPLLQDRVARAVAAAFLGVRPRRALVGIIAGIMVLSGGFYAAVVLNPPERYRRAIAQFGEPKPINEWASIVGYHIERSARGVSTIDLIYESHGPMPKNLQIFLHADVLDEDGELAWWDGRNFFPSLITSHWPAGKYVVARTTAYFAPQAYLIKAGFFDLDNGRRFGQAELGRVDLSALRESDR